jgi:farnesyl-diphosphate farnesyltransferase
MTTMTTATGGNRKLTSSGNRCFICEMVQAQNELLTDLLKQVSRSFYLTVRVLPKSIRSQIGLGYLLARTTDTVADTEIVPVEQRLKLLQALRERILGMSSAPVDFGELARHQGSPAERVLLEKCEAGVALLEAQSPADRKLIRDVLDTITSGQELDLKRFEANGRPSRHGADGTPSLIALQTDEELDDYTYRVAGCVGRFWTRVCLAHQFSTPSTTDSSFEELGVRFGKGLQLVNILRDIPADLKKGRCYIPSEKLAAAGLSPADLLRPENEPKFRPLYNKYLDLTESHLAAGWKYTNLIPFGQMRVRLGCAWLILIGLRTIGRLRSENVLDPWQRIKIDRGEVKQIMFWSLVLYPFQGKWRRQASLKVQEGESVASGQKIS